jgi:hypothetical protein
MDYCLAKMLNHLIAQTDKAVVWKTVQERVVATTYLLYHNIKISFYIIIMSNQNEIPGNTDLSSYELSRPAITSLEHPRQRPAVILATNDVNDVSLFLNGLTQNILILYDLFESLGYDSYLIQHNPNNPTEKKGLYSSVSHHHAKGTYPTPYAD